MDTIILDHQLQETLVFPDPSFPIQYYVDDLHQWAGRQVPLHWHFGYEFFSAVSQDIEVQVGNEQLMLLKGESILITGGQLHSYRLTSPQEPCLCPNIVFSDDVLAPLTSTVFRSTSGISSMTQPCPASLSRARRTGSGKYPNVFSAYTGFLQRKETSAIPPRIMPR